MQKLLLMIGLFIQMVVGILLILVGILIGEPKKYNSVCLVYEYDTVKES